MPSLDEGQGDLLPRSKKLFEFDGLLGVSLSFVSPFPFRKTVVPGTVHPKAELFFAPP